MTAFPLPVDRLRQSTYGQRVAWLAVVSEPDGEARDTPATPEEIAEAVEIAREQGRREAVCPVCGARQDYVEIDDPE